MIMGQSDSWVRKRLLPNVQLPSERSTLHYLTTEAKTVSFPDIAILMRERVAKALVLQVLFFYTSLLLAFIDGIKHHHQKTEHYTLLYQACI